MGRWRARHDEEGYRRETGPGDTEGDKIMPVPAVSPAVGSVLGSGRPGRWRWRPPRPAAPAARPPRRPPPARRRRRPEGCRCRRQEPADRPAGGGLLRRNGRRGGRTGHYPGHPGIPVSGRAHRRRCLRNPDESQAAGGGDGRKETVHHQRTTSKPRPPRQLPSSPTTAPSGTACPLQPPPPSSPTRQRTVPRPAPGSSPRHAVHRGPDLRLFRIGPAANTDVEVQPGYGIVHCPVGPGPSSGSGAPRVGCPGAARPRSCRHRS